MGELGRILIVFGIVLVVLGAIFLVAPRVPFLGRRLPSAAARAARELPAAWHDIGVDGVRGAVREARRVAGAWTAETR